MIWRRLRRVPRDERAVVAPMVAALTATLLGTAGFALDAGLYYVGNRDLRAATEAAALAAAMDPRDGLNRARNYLARNGRDPSVLQSIQIGRYCPDISLRPEDRFDPGMTRCPGNGQENAVRLHTSAPSRQFLSQLLGPLNPIPPLAATASAARIDEAGIEATSGILTVTNSLVNSVNNLLGALLGIQLVLTTADVEALMGGNVDAGLFFDKLADRIGETGTYGDLAKRRVKLGDIMAAARDSAGDPRTERVLGLLAGQVGKNPEIPLSGLFGLGLLEDMPIGGRDGQPALRAGMNAYQLWAFAVQGQPGSLNLSKPVDLLIPGSVVRLTGMANGPAARPRFSFGPAGETSVNTSTLRLQLEIGLGLLRLIGALVDVRVPILIDIGAGGADLQKISCADTDEQARDTEVTLHGYSGLVNAYIGTPPNNAMVSPMPALSEGQIGQVRLVNVLGLITVDARAVASPVLGRSEDVSFGPDGPGRVGTPASPGAPVTIGNNAAAGPLLNSLIDSLSGADGLQVKLLGLCLPLICSENIAIVRQTLLGGLVAPIAGLVGNTADPLLDNLLAALGIQLGHTSLWVTGARCGVPVLI